MSQNKGLHALRKIGACWDGKSHLFSPFWDALSLRSEAPLRVVCNQPFGFSPVNAYKTSLYATSYRFQLYRATFLISLPCLAEMA